MLKLTAHIQLDEAAIRATNLTSRFSDEDLSAISTYCLAGYSADKASRAQWELRMQSGLNLALQMLTGKNFPWPNCSNVAFPLVTIAAIQFHARAYPAIIPGPDIVKYRVLGEDPQGVERDRALRIGRHMSWQLLEEDTAWEEQQDRLLFSVPIVGCAFKKTYHDGGAGRNTSEMVLAQDLVMDYYAKSVETCRRKTHVIPMDRNEIFEKCATEVFRDVREEPWFRAPARPVQDANTAAVDKRAGSAPPPQSDDSTPFTVYEQHCWLDLDGDGYQEPYVVTLEAASQEVLRIVSRVDAPEAIHRTSGGIYRIDATEYFTKYEFIPAPDGGVYSLGFGVLLGPLNESVNSLINQLVDAGTMSNSAGGFLARGAKIRGGVYTFAPLEWKRVDSSGDDLKKSVFPLPVREPSMVLFQLLSLLINYTQRVAGTTDTLVGENPGQNTPAETTRTMVQQGLKIYTAIFKRIWRASKEEFRKLYLLNRNYLPRQARFGDGGVIRREDYLGKADRIAPVADPNMTSDVERVQQAIAVKQSAMGTPGYSLPEVEKAYLRALRVENMELLYPGPDKVPPLPNPKVQVEQLRLQAKQMELETEKQSFLMDLLEERRLNNAKILKLEAEAAKALAEAGGVQTGQNIAAFQAALGALKAHDEALRGRIDQFIKAAESDREYARQSPDGRGIQGMAPPPSNAGAPASAAGASGGAQGAMG